MTGSDTASRARSVTTDPGERPLENVTGVPVKSLGPVGPLPKVSALPLKEELPTFFEVKARILDFYPITLDEENCLLRMCSDCKNLSVPYVVFLHPLAPNVSSKDRGNRGVVPELLDLSASSARAVPLLAFVHVVHGKRGGARSNSWKH